MATRGYESEIVEAKRSGAACLGPQTPVSEISLAAVLDCDRKEIVETLFASGAVPFVRIGDHRYVTTARLVAAGIERLAQAEKGGAE